MKFSWRTLRKCIEVKILTMSMCGEGDGEERQKIRFEIVSKMFNFDSGFFFFSYILLRVKGLFLIWRGVL